MVKLSSSRFRRPTRCEGSRHAQARRRTETRERPTCSRRNANKTYPIGRRSSRTPTSNRPLVFDAEPLIAHADDELGAEYVAKLLNAVESGDRGGYASQTTIAEVRCVLARNHDRALRRVPRLARHHRCRTGRHRRCLAADCRLRAPVQSSSRRRRCARHRRTTRCGARRRR